MTAPPEQDSNEGSSSTTLQEVQRLLSEINEAKSKASAALELIETARQKADSEALFAFNAKQACETHSSAIAAIKGTAESDTNAILANKQKSDEIIAAVNSAKAGIDADVKAINSSRKEVEKSAQDIAAATASGVTHLATITTSMNEASVASKSVTSNLDAAARAAGATENARATAEKSSTEATSLTSNVVQKEKEATQQTAEIAAMLSDARTSEQKLKDVWIHLEESDALARKVEETNAKHSRELDELKIRIESLLPGATSAGLASSFSSQKARFGAPQKRWLIIFIVCICGLIVLALPSFLAAMGVRLTSSQAYDSWDGTLRSLALRLPILFPLVWLAIYAGRNYMLSLRLEEDYAYKEAISTAFEGYKREMEKITTGTAEEPSPLVTLCTNILTAIAERPGRIYEGKQKDINLLTETGALAAKGAEFSRKQVASS
jgi:hypothetical protein